MYRRKIIRHALEAGHAIVEDLNGVVIQRFCQSVSRRDESIQSNSNINANPNFGYCFSDYIDLLTVSHAGALVSTDELLATQETVANVTLRLGGIFTQVGDSHQRYLAYIEQLQPA